MKHWIASCTMLCLLVGVAWACKPPDPVTGFSVQSVAQTTVTVAFDAPTRGKVAVRLSPIPTGWGAAKEAPCETSPCVVDGLDPATTYDIQANPFVVTKTQGTIYGNPTESISVTTQATALQAVIAAHPGQFVTCIYTTGTVIHPNCTP